MTSRSRYTSAEIELLDQLDPDVRPLRFVLNLYRDAPAAAAAILALHRDGLLEVLTGEGNSLRTWELEQALRDEAAWNPEPQLYLRLTDRGAAFIS